MRTLLNFLAVSESGNAFFSSASSDFPGLTKNSVNFVELLSPMFFGVYVSFGICGTPIGHRNICARFANGERSLPLVPTGRVSGEFLL